MAKGDVKIILVVLAFLLVYVLLLEVIGFVLMTTLFIFCCSFVLGYKKHLTNGIVSVFFSLIIYGLFNYLLNINLPAGILPI